MYCEKLFEGLEKRLNEKKSIDQIAKELCPTLADPRAKVIDLIKIYKGGKYLFENYDWLGYHKDQVRNRKGRYESSNQEKRLQNVSLKIRIPTAEEYYNWKSILNKASQDFQVLYSEVSKTTDSRYLWRIKMLIKRVNELEEILKTSESQKEDLYNELEKIYGNSDNQKIT